MAAMTSRVTSAYMMDILMDLETTAIYNWLFY
jgi:hypothetical protein